jgi:hypothetical protein
LFWVRSSDGIEELKIAGLSARSGSLKAVRLARLFSSTLTTNAIAVAEIVLETKFLQSFGLIHGRVKLSNVLLYKCRYFQIADFRLNQLDSSESAAFVRGVVSEFTTHGMLSDQERTSKIDVSSFALILFEIVVGLPALGRTSAFEEVGKLPVNAWKSQYLFCKR